MRTVMRMDDLRFVTKLAGQVSDGAMSYGFTSRPGDGESRYVGHTHTWLGRNGGRTNAMAYYFGAAMEWVRCAGVELDNDTVKRLQEIREASCGARGEWGHWSLEGRVDAAAKWRAVNTLEIWSKSAGVMFKAVRQGVAYNGDDLISFYDMRYPHTEFGQFTGGRFALGDLRGRSREFDLQFDGGVPNWWLDRTAMVRVHEWLDGLAERNLNRNRP